jgi:hypothetical protein
MIDVKSANKIASETVFSTPDVMVLSEYHEEEEAIKNILYLISASGMETVRSYLYYNNGLPVEVIDFLYKQAYAKCNIQ